MHIFEYRSFRAHVNTYIREARAGGSNKLKDKLSQNQIFITS
jgi:hypothetical protein